MTSHGGDTEAHAHAQTESGDALLFLFHSRLLGARLYIHSLSRFLIVLTIFAGTLFAKHVVGISELNTPAFLLLGTLLGLYNIPVFVMARRYRKPEHMTPPHTLLTGLMHTTILFDFIFLTALLALVGGAGSPFKAFYLIHVILAALLLSPLAAYLHALAGYAMFASLVAGQWLEWIPVQVPRGAVNGSLPLDGRYMVTVLVVQGILMSFTAFLVSGLTRMLRQGEKRLGDANAELTRLSNMRRSFLHITLHDLKAPVDAITMLLQNLSSGLGGPLSEQQSHWVQRCNQRLHDLSLFLRDFQTLAMLDSEGLTKNGDLVDMEGLLKAVTEEYTELAEQRLHTLTLRIEGPLLRVHGVERLLREAVANLVTNAIKYTPLGGSIEVRAGNAEEAVYIEVKDNGIGISPEDRKKLFQEFVRLRPKQDRTGEVTGSGLGLSIVQRIMEMHHGSVTVASEPGQGSVFTLELPAELES